ncbi:unnamed protein product [Thelazia callipaeda]|uniref:60S ribosomal protein L31 n=1 Tax=Thelazia callipaeda TaxID=103827 RepID=A0A0N5DCC1_THECL|nr:unnamed protein product [Thelazia callipaeda]
MDDCVCTASDLRFGEQMTTIATDMKVCLGGFHSDAKTVVDKIIFRKNLNELKENRKIKPKVKVKDEFNDYKDVCILVDVVIPSEHH